MLKDTHRNLHDPSIGCTIDDGLFIFRILYRASAYYKFPRDSCSLSSASNKALKFPFPKLLAPLR